ncbi:MAG: hypothetical protein FWE02_05990 [Defluviitaleaceae bacterium]|nr:hypothetical protein [Defluviitaleaceae bacterium]
MIEIIYLYLDYTGYEIKHVNELKITHAINEHSELFISAVLEEGESTSPIFNTNVGSQIGVKNEETGAIIFKGMIKDIQIKHLSKAYTVEISAISNTFMLDAELIRRSFQDESMMYTALVDEVISEHDGCAYIFKEDDKPIEAFTMQFDETDWRFIKRMASRFNAGLVVDHHFDTPKFFFGIPQGQNHGELENYNFYMKKNVASYMVSSKNWNDKISELDSINFFVQADKEFTIGDTVTHQGTNLYVKSFEASVVDGALLYTHELSTENGLTQDKLYNNKIIGLSIEGKVLETVRDQVKVHLEIDDEPPSPPWEFPYTTSYTAEGHAGWYCMPEIDDTVYIYFPNEKEAEGVSVNSIRKQGGVDNPEIKIFRTPNGKELRFTPEEILITCIDDDIFIRLHEDTGIEVISSKPINVVSDSNINIKAEEMVNITANKEILLTCQGSFVKLDDKVHVEGTKVLIS